MTMPKDLVAIYETCRKYRSITMLEQLKSYLNDGHLVEEVVSADGKNSYMMPSRRNAGHVVIVLVRQIIAPTVFRNAEEETTDVLDLDGVRRVRAVPNKFKFGERGRGLLVLRCLDAGGRLPQNRTAIGTKMQIGEAFDLNTLVFGDSAMDGTRVLPVKAAVQYSDALSVKHYGECVGEEFHNRSDETGTLFDAEKKVNSPNLFTRHFLLPGTLLVQTLTANGCQLPPIGFDHLMLSVGIAGSYGGQTSVAGTNVRTHIAGVFASRLEMPLSSPYELLKQLQRNNSRNSFAEMSSVDDLTSAIFEAMEMHYAECFNSQTATKYLEELVRTFENDDPDLRARYQQAKKDVAEMFNRYFGPGKKKSG